MVNNILDYAKIKAKKLNLDLQPTCMKDLLAKIYQMHQVKIK
jgi:signal transduction histidine kinase